jgi:hypothetical protein
MQQAQAQAQANAAAQQRGTFDAGAFGQQVLDATDEINRQRIQGSIDDSTQGVGEWSPSGDIVPEVSPASPRATSLAAVEPMWSMQDMEEDQGRIDRGIQEGAERVAGDDQHRQNQMAWIDQQAAEIPQQPMAEVLPDTSIDQAAVGKKAEEAMRGIYQTHNRINDTQIRPPVDNAKPPFAGFAGDAGPKQAAAQRGKNTQASKRGGWTDPAESPLPGEETLPPQVAAWNQGRTSGGQMGGMASLRRAYDIAQDSAPTGQTFEEWLRAQGMHSGLGPEEASATLNRILADSQINFPNHDPMGLGGEDPRVNAADDSVLAGRMGLADNTPLDHMTPEQRRRIGTNRDGVPRTARGGQEVWDETAADGKGGYVPRGVDLQAARNAKSVYERARALGINFTAYGDNTAQLEADVAKVMQRQEQLAGSYDTAQVAGGGTRLVPNAASRARSDEMRARQFEQTMAKRFAGELKTNGIPVGEIGAAYRSHLARNPGDHAGAARYVNGMYLDTMRSQQSQNRALAVKQSADQYNRGREFGVSRGSIAFFDSLQNAQSPQERANVLMLAHQSQPHMGYDKVAAMLMRGEIDNQAIGQWAQQMGGRQNVQQQIAQNVSNFSGAPPTMATHAQITHHVMSTPGMANAKPEVVKAEVAKYALPIIRQRIATGEPLNEQERGFASSTLSSDFDEFATQIGMTPQDPRAAQVYQQVFGSAPDTRSLWGQAWDGLQWLAGQTVPQQTASAGQ